MDNGLNAEKDRIRNEIRKLKKMVSPEDKLKKSYQIFQQLEQKSYFQQTDIILAYWAMPDEVQTRDFVLKWCLNKTVLLPVVRGDELELRLFTGEDKMVLGSSFGIYEPTGDVFEQIDSIDLIIVPGIAFDKNMNRLGRGKAYYDKLLKDTNAFKAGVCFDFQIIENVPAESHDVKMDDVIFG